MTAPCCCASYSTTAPPSGSPSPTPVLAHTLGSSSSDITSCVKQKRGGSLGPDGSGGRPRSCSSPGPVLCPQGPAGESETTPQRAHLSAPSCSDWSLASRVMLNCRLLGPSGERPWLCPLRPPAAQQGFFYGSRRTWSSTGKARHMITWSHDHPEY